MADDFDKDVLKSLESDLGITPPPAPIKERAVQPPLPKEQDLEGDVLRGLESDLGIEQKRSAVGEMLDLGKQALWEIIGVGVKHVGAPFEELIAQKYASETDPMSPAEAEREARRQAVWGGGEVKFSPKAIMERRQARTPIRELTSALPGFEGSSVQMNEKGQYVGHEGSPARLGVGAAIQGLIAGVNQGGEKIPPAAAATASLVGDFALSPPDFIADPLFVAALGPAGKAGAWARARHIKKITRKIEEGAKKLIGGELSLAEEVANRGGVSQRHASRSVFLNTDTARSAGVVQPEGLSIRRLYDDLKFEGWDVGKTLREFQQRIMNDAQAKAAGSSALGRQYHPRVVERLSRIDKSIRHEGLSAKEALARENARLDIEQGTPPDVALRLQRVAAVQSQSLNPSGPLEGVITNSMKPTAWQSLRAHPTETIRRTYRRFVQDWFDKDSSLRQALRWLGVDQPDLHGDAYIASRMIRSRILSVVENDIKELLGPVSKRIKDAGHDPEEFIRYARLRHELDMSRKQEMGILKFDEPVSQWTIPQLEGAVRKLEKPGYTDAHTKLVGVQNRVLYRLVTSGVWTEDQWRAAVKLYPYYIPGKPYEPIGGFGSKARGTATRSGPRRLRGGRTSAVEDPWKTMVENFAVYTSAAENNVARRMMVDQFARTPNGYLMMEKTNRKVRPFAFSGEEISRQLKNAGVKNLAKLEDPSVAFKIFRPTDLAPNEFVIYRKGVPEVWKFNELGRDIARLVLSAPPLVTPVTAFMNFFSKLTRVGATQLNLDFMARNLFRDTFGRLIQSKTKGLALRSIPDIFQAMLDVAGRRPLYREARRAGGFTGGFYATDRDVIHNALGRAMMGKKWYGKPGHWLDAIQVANQFLEDISRMAEYRGIRRELAGKGMGFKAGKGLAEAKLRAAYGAREATLDFLRSGFKGQEFNKVIAFFNAGLQDYSKVARTFQEQPAQTIGRGLLYVTLPTVALWYINKDNPDYHRLATYRRSLMWNIPIPGTHSHFSFPKPFLWGQIFANTVEEGLNWWYQKDPAYVNKLMKEWGIGATIPFLPTLFTPIFMLMANKDVFRGKDVETANERTNLEPFLRYGRETSSLGKAAGYLTRTLPDGLKISPKMFDAVSRGVAAGLATQVIGAASLLGRGAKKAGFFGDAPIFDEPIIPEWSDVVVLRSMFKTSNGLDYPELDFFNKRGASIIRKYGSIRTLMQDPERYGETPAEAVRMAREWLGKKYADLDDRQALQTFLGWHDIYTNVRTDVDKLFNLSGIIEKTWPDGKLKENKLRQLMGYINFYVQTANHLEIKERDLEDMSQLREGEVELIEEFNKQNEALEGGDQSGLGPAGALGGMAGGAGMVQLKTGQSDPMMSRYMKGAAEEIEDWSGHKTRPGKEASLAQAYRGFDTDEKLVGEAQATRVWGNQGQEVANWERQSYELGKGAERKWGRGKTIAHEIGHLEWSKIPSELRNTFMDEYEALHAKLKPKIRGRGMTNGTYYMHPNEAWANVFAKTFFGQGSTDNFQKTSDALQVWLDKNRNFSRPLHETLKEMNPAARALYGIWEEVTGKPYSPELAEKHPELVSKVLEKGALKFGSPSMARASSSVNEETLKSFKVKKMVDVLLEGLSRARLPKLRPRLP